MGGWEGWSHDDDGSLKKALLALIVLGSGPALLVGDVVGDVVVPLVCCVLAPVQVKEDPSVLAGKSCRKIIK